MRLHLMTFSIALVSASSNLVLAGTDPVSNASMSDYNASLWAVYGQRSDVKTESVFSLSGNHDFLMNKSVDWRAGSASPPFGQTVGRVNGKFMTTFKVESAGNAGYTLSLTKSSGASLIVNTFELDHSKLSIEEDNKFLYATTNRGGTAKGVLNNAELIFANDALFGATDSASKLELAISGNSLIRGLQGNSSLGRWGLQGENFNVAENANLTLWQWDTRLETYGTAATLAINLAKNSSLLIDDSTIDQLTTSDANFLIKANAADVTISDSDVILNEASLSDSTFKINGTAQLREKLVMSLNDANTITVEDTASFEDLRTTVYSGTATIQNNSSQTLSLSSLKFTSPPKGTNDEFTYVLTSSQGNEFAINEINFKDRSRLVIGEAGDSSNTDVSFVGGSLFMDNVNDAAVISGHANLAFNSNTSTYLFLEELTFSPGVDNGEIGTINIDLNGGSLSSPLINSASALRYRIDIDPGSNTNDKIVYTNGDVKGDVTLELNAATALNAADLDGQSYDVVESPLGKDQSSYQPIEAGSNIPTNIKFTGVIAQTATNDIYRVAATIDNNQLTTATNKNPTVKALVTAANQGNALAQSVLNQVTVGHVQQGQHKSIDPESYSSYLSVQAQALENRLFNVFDHHLLVQAQPAELVNGTGASDASLDDLSIWTDAAYREGNVKGKNGLGSFDYNTTSIALGGLFLSSEAISLGAYAGVSQTRMDEHDNLDMEFSGHNFDLGLYAFSPVGPISGHYVVGFAHQSSSSKRQVEFAGQRETANADFDGRSIYASVRFLHSFMDGNKVNYTPFAQLSLIHHQQDKFKEKGAANFALEIEQADVQSNLLSMGVEISAWQLSNTVSLKGLFRYDFDFSAGKDGHYEIEAAGIGSTSVSHKVNGQNRGEHIFNAGFGVEWFAGDGMRLGADINHEIASHGEESGVSLYFEVEL